MNSGKRCFECGNDIPRDSPGGYCAQCLLELGLAGGESSSGRDLEPVGEPGESGKRERLEENRPGHVSPAEKAGDRIGRYRLIKEIGHGGCGVVYLAEQEEPVRRKVALKVIKLGMDTRQVVARFEAERQALALMDHPNIARVLDAGATDAGRPYFVMELVDGIRITDYCVQNSVALDQRLDLFMQVCRAIQHAHQKGVIHRDIKPSNVLVSETDGKPLPKVIDFGIAKATQGRLTEETVFTSFNQFLGTPAYMSPEQAQRGELDIDTRSDIYSLGVLLYELLTGTTPFDTKKLLEDGVEAVRHAIRDEEPPTPSTRLKQELIARHCQSSGGSGAESPKVRVDKDLDWIVMKCLEKDRARRYETANGLAMDVERHLNHEPVVAGPPGKLYRFQKLVRRNRGVALTSLLVLFALVLGAVVSAWQAWRATHAEVLANREAEKSSQVAQLLQDMLAGVGPSKALGRDTTMLREILDKAVARIEAELTIQPEVEYELRIILAETYKDLGAYERMEEMARHALDLSRNRLHGRPEPARSTAVGTALRQLGGAQLGGGKLDQAEQSLREALAIERTSLGPEHRDVGRSLNDLSLVLMEKGKLSEAERVSREALTLQRKLFGSEDTDTATSLNTLGGVLQKQGRPKDAEIAWTEALGAFRKLLGDDHPTLAAVRNNLAAVFQSQDKFADAERTLREVLVMYRRFMGNEHLLVARALDNLADVLCSQGKFTEAEDCSRQALSMLPKLVGPEHVEVSNALNNLGLSLESQGRLAEAEAAFRDSLKIRRKLFGPEHATVAISLGNLGGTLRLQGKPSAAEEMFREGLAIQRKLLGDQHPQVATSLRLLSDALALQDKLVEAEWAIREAIAIQTNAFGKAHTELANSMNVLAHILLEKGKTTDAEAVHREVLAMQRDLLGGEHPNVAKSMDNLAVILEKAGKLEEAEDLCRKALAIQLRNFGTNHLDVAHALHNLSAVLEREEKFSEAESAITQALLIRRQHLPAPHPDVASSLDTLASILREQNRLEEAETAYRELLKMRRELLGSAHPDIARTMNNLASVLSPQGKHAEAESIYLEVLEMARKLFGDDDFRVGIALGGIGRTQERQGKLTDAEAAFRQQLATNRKALSAVHPDTMSALNSLVFVLQQQNKDADVATVCLDHAKALRRQSTPERAQLASALGQVTYHLLTSHQYEEAEVVATRCLAMREKGSPDDWLTYNTRSMLGASLLGQNKLDQAGPLLLAGYEGMKQREPTIPETGKIRLKEALERLVQFYSATGPPDQAAHWKDQLEASKKAHSPAVASQKNQP